MNREETIKAIKVMQVFVDGGQVINKLGVNLSYKHVCCPSWNWGGNIDSYKVKPFDCWNNIYERHIDSYRSEIDAINNCNETIVIRRAVHMREVEK